MATYINGIAYECLGIDNYAAAMAANVCEKTSRGGEMIVSVDKNRSESTVYGKRLTKQPP
jgi:hypothetical protein